MNLKSSYADWKDAKAQAENQPAGTPYREFVIRRCSEMLALPEDQLPEGSPKGILVREIKGGAK